MQEHVRGLDCLFAMTIRQGVTRTVSTPSFHRKQKAWLGIGTT
ncbi:hypothetical protein GMO_22990 [Gluconobacter morbifer G707]|uniref:Uncharacterized protein n=1 Tax=Gluconobacter morbifer G707 TaxID=1088869 RepID=G6XLQ0_9PROT|nr:hypothetical protein GMO_22990 [Gluconobacter morbifer G707]